MMGKAVLSDNTKLVIQEWVNALTEEQCIEAWGPLLRMLSLTDSHKDWEGVIKGFEIIHANIAHPTLDLPKYALECIEQRLIGTGKWKEIQSPEFHS